MDLPRSGAVLALAVVLLGPASSTAHAWERAVTETGAPLFWPTRRIVVRPLPDPSGALPDAEVARALDRSAASWSSLSSCSDLLVVREGVAGGGETNLDGGSYDGENRVVIRRDRWPAELGGETLALTTSAYLTRTGELLDSDVDLNGVDHAFVIGDGAPPPSENDLENTLTHELGHAVGLSHSADGGATMFGGSTPGEILKRDLSADDVDAICTIYPRGRPTPGEPLSRTLGCGCTIGGPRVPHACAALGLALAVGAFLRRSRRRQQRGE